jgi:hypothetical protein
MLLQPAPAVMALQSIVVALATPLLLLSADLSVILKRTGLMLRAFVCGAIGTALGALLGFWLVRAHCISSARTRVLSTCVREKRTSSSREKGTSTGRGRQKRRVAAAATQGGGGERRGNPPSSSAQSLLRRILLSLSKRRVEE